eukprot:s1740_g14.t1
MVAEDLKVNFQNPHVILIDFGLSSTFLSTERGIWGTPGYIPPETFVSLFWVPKGDIFSAGVMFYQILSGRLAPFAHPSTPQTHSSGGEVNWDAVEERTRQIDLPVDDIRASVSCKSMLKRMTSKDFKLRPTARECLELPWFSQAKPESLVAMAALDRLKALQTRSASQKAIFEKMLSACNLAQMRSLNDLFRIQGRSGNVKELSASSHPSYLAFDAFATSWGCKSQVPNFRCLMLSCWAMLELLGHIGLISWLSVSQKAGQRWRWRRHQAGSARGFARGRYPARDAAKAGGNLDWP